MGDKKTSKQLLQEFTAKTYDEIREAKENGELIGWSTSNFPKEICQTFDLKIMYPENHSAAVAAKKGAIPFCEKAEGLGYSMDLCSYARINLGFVEREEDFGFGLDVPAPTSAQRLSSGTRISRTILTFLFCSSIFHIIRTGITLPTRPATSKHSCNTSSMSLSALQVRSSITRNFMRFCVFRA